MNNPVLKTILGSILRHFLSVFLGVLVGRGLVSHDDASGAVALLTNDMASNLLVAFFVSILPIAWSIWSRLMLRLREKIALRLHKGATETQVKNIIAAAPWSAQVSAVLTNDPMKIVAHVCGAAEMSAA